MEVYCWSLPNVGILCRYLMQGGGAVTCARVPLASNFASSFTPASHFTMG